jgi:lipoprotein signal peptidase
MNITRVRTVGALLIGCVGCDQVTKGLVRANLELGVVQPFLFNTFRLIHAGNSGAFLSPGSSLPPAARFLIFVTGIGQLRTGIFNIADIALMIGVALWLVAQGRKAT